MRLFTKTLSVIVFMLICTIITGAEFSFEWQWAQRAGGRGTGVSYDLVTDDEGNSYLTGYITETAHFGDIELEMIEADDYDVFIAKIDKDGNWLWAQRAGGVRNDEAFAVDIDQEGNVYITGWFWETIQFGDIELVGERGRDIYVAKLNSEGEWVWARQVHGPGYGQSKANGITTDNEGDIYITGEHSGAISFGDIKLDPIRYSDNIFVAKLSSEGSWQWAIGPEIEGPHNSSNDISVDENRNSYVTGSFSDKITFGNTELTPEGDGDVFVAKLDAGGNWLWAKRAGGEQRSAGQAIATDKKGNSYLTGMFTGRADFGEHNVSGGANFDIFAAKIDADGKWIWANSGTSVGNCSGRDIVFDEQGNSYLTGSISEETRFADIVVNPRDINIIIASLDSEGEWQWAEQAGGPDWALGHGIGIDSDGCIYVSGYMQRIAWFGDVQVDAQGWNDVFIAKIAEAETNISPDDNIAVNSDRKFSLYPNYPNPFNPETTISYHLHRDVDSVELNIYNINGQKIRTLVPSNPASKGDYTVVWDGKDDNRMPVGSGVYFYRIKSGNRTETNRMLMIK